MRAKILRQIDEDYALVEDLEIDNEPCIMDSEGQRVCFLPPVLLTMGTATQQDTVMLNFAQTIYLAKDEAAENGSRYGQDLIRGQVQKLLGVDRISEKLGEISIGIEIASRGKS